MSFWLFNTLASVVRGAGNMLLPASLVVGGSALTLALSPLLIAGWEPVPSLGIAGAGVALLAYYSLGSVVLLVYLSGGKSLVRLTVAGQRLQGALFWAILRVGVPASLNTVLTNLNVALLTSLVGPFGTFALAGYGLGARLEYLQIPLVFGFGSALVTMVSTNIGAGRIARAQRIAWIGAGLAAAVTGSVGLFGACFPTLWLGLFTTHPEVLAAGTAYLRLVGPTYGCFGLGLALYFASQGAGRLLWPLVTVGTRLAIAAGGGWLASAWFSSSLTGIYIAIAAAFVIYAASMVAAIKASAWQDL